MGIGTMRVQSGNWKHAQGFRRPHGPPRRRRSRSPGYTNDDGFKWTIEAYEQNRPRSRKKRGVTMGFEKPLGPGPHARRRPPRRQRHQLPLARRQPSTPATSSKTPTTSSPSSPPKAALVQSKNLLRRWPSGTRWISTTTASPSCCARRDIADTSRSSLREREDPRTAVPKSFGVVEKGVCGGGCSFKRWV